jgi:hypothetical protein
MGKCECGREIEPIGKLGGHPRKRCSVCSPFKPRRKPLAAVVDLPTQWATPVNGGEDVPIPTVPTGPGAMVLAVRAQLEHAGVSGSVDGILAEQIAKVVDMGGLSRPGAAALAKSLRETLAAALVGHADGDDPLDEMYG